MYKFYNDSHQYSHNRQLSMDVTYCLLNSDDTLTTKVTCHHLVLITLWGSREGAPDRAPWW